MKQTKLIMGMPISIEVADDEVKKKDLADIFHIFRVIDDQFSPYKKTSEVSRINRKEITPDHYSDEMKAIIRLAEQTKKETDGYFDVFAKGYFDPSGVVKAWAIEKAAQVIEEKKFTNYYLNVGGDIKVGGKNSKGDDWTIGIRNPFQLDEVVKVIQIGTNGIATSGSYLRGQHIVDPYNNKAKNNIVSLTVIAKTVMQADLLATAAFAMGEKGIYFLEKTKEVEAYMIDREGIATYTTGFTNYVRFD